MCGARKRSRAATLCGFLRTRFDMVSPSVAVDVGKSRARQLNRRFHILSPSAGGCGGITILASGRGILAVFAGSRVGAVDGACACVVAHLPSSTLAAGCGPVVSASLSV